MKVKVKAFAWLREIIGDKETEVELEEGAKVEELLRSICEAYDIEIYEKEGKIRDDVKILKNGRFIESLDGLKTRLDEGDEVAILPPVSGG